MTLETINHFIDIQISRNRSKRTIILSQESFVHRILKRFSIANCNPKVVPADPYTNLSEVSPGKDDDDFDQSMYREAVGCVMYADFGVTYHANLDAPHILLAYSDSDYAGDTSSRRSTSGYLLLLNGGPISWASRRQQCMSLSTTEAEYVAMCETLKDLRYLDAATSTQYWITAISTNYPALRQSNRYETCCKPGVS